MATRLILTGLLTRLLDWNIMRAGVDNSRNTNMVNKEKKYRGWRNDTQKWEEFVSRPEDATPEASGYDKVEILE